MSQPTYSIEPSGEDPRFADDGIDPETGHEYACKCNEGQVCTCSPATRRTRTNDIDHGAEV
jgi:hypothetical protein